MKRKYYLPFLIVAAFLVGFLLNKCSEKEPPIIVPVFDSIPFYKAKIDSLSRNVTVEYLDRVKYRTRWAKIRHDSIIPCEVKLTICDTLILKDDSLINSLLVKDTVNTRFNEYLVNRIQYDSIVLADTCKYFKKQIKRQKLYKWIAIGAGVVGTTIGR